MRPLHESVAKGEISLIEAGNEANNELLVSFPTKSSEITYARSSLYLTLVFQPYNQ